MLEKLLLYDNQQPRLPIINIILFIMIVRFIDYPKGVLIIMIILLLGSGGKFSYENIWYCEI